jgi:transposase
MPKRRYLTLTAEQKTELENVRDRHPKAYFREKAAALLKIADGMSPHQVALHGLFKARDPDTVYLWMNRYEAEGLGGLLVKPGRGRKPAFSPSVQK